MRVLATLLVLGLAACQGRRIAERPTVRLDPAAHRLASEDFVTRQRAAEQLVEAGVDAIPVLGRLGDVKVEDVAGRQVSATTPVLRSILDEQDDARVRELLDAAWPNVRREAATELGRRDGMTSVPRLIEALEDEDAEVRLAAVASLRRLTHRFFGYRAAGTLEARRRASAKWREWWAVQVKR